MAMTFEMQELIRGYGTKSS